MIVKTMKTYIEKVANVSIIKPQFVMFLFDFGFSFRFFFFF